MSRSNHWWKPHFATKKSLEDKIRGIAKSCPLGAELGDVDTQFMVWVLSHHDEFDEKCGVGLKSIIVTLDDFGNRFFSIKRKDDIVIDISWKYALNPKSNERKHFLSALREEVKDQIFAFKKSSKAVCGICNNDIRGDSHVDHIVPFRQLVKMYFGDDIHETVDMGPMPSKLLDRKIAEGWCRFHKDNAKLQMSHAKCNLKKG